MIAASSTISGTSDGVWCRIAWNRWTADRVSTNSATAPASDPIAVSKLCGPRAGGAVGEDVDVVMDSPPPRLPEGSGNRMHEGAALPPPLAT